MMKYCQRMKMMLMMIQLLEMSNEWFRWNPAIKKNNFFVENKIVILTKRLLTNKIINDIGIRHTVDRHVVIA
jgi:hypothetical protein